DARDPAVLDLVPPARLRLDRADGNEQLVQQAPDGLVELAGSDRLGAEVDPDDEHELRRRARHGLFLSALHDPAALCQPRKARPDAGRGLDGPRLAALPGLP